MPGGESIGSTGASACIGNFLVFVSCTAIREQTEGGNDRARARKSTWRAPVVTM